MEKIILAGFVVFTFSIFQVGFVYATPKEVSCGEMKRLWDGKGECKFPIYKIETNSLWCGSSYEYVSHINDYEPSYKLPPGVVCPGLSNESKMESKEEKQPLDNQIREPLTSETNIFQVISDNFRDIYLTRAEFTKGDTDVLNMNVFTRTPRLTEEIINISQKEWKNTPTPDSNETTSPYRLDILNGKIQIKLPGQSDWKDLKQGDRIPPGSTIFTGMDSTTVLSIRDKGVVQVQSFTEITVSEKGLEEAANTGQTYTDLELKKGEIEVNIEKGIYPSTGFPSMYIEAVYTTSSVRGTHFWVKHDDKMKTDTIGVYEGNVEVVTKDGQTTAVSPIGDNPGVVIVTQKLSIVKILVVGAVAVIIIGSVILFIKKNKKDIQRKK